MSMLNTDTSAASAGRIESILLVPLAGTIEVVVDSVFHYTDADSQGAEDFMALIALIEPEARLCTHHRLSLG